MKLTKIITILTLIGLTQTSKADTTNGTFSVTAKITASCSITTNTLDFLTPVQQESTSYFSTSAKLNIACTKATPYSISLNGGLSGDFNNMYMRGSRSGNSDKLSYKLYQDMYFTTLFTNVANSGHVNGIGNGATQNIDVWGKLPASQLVTPDVYTDQITVTIAY